MTSSATTPRSSPFVPVPCRCGRLLRAKYDQIGTEIQCWDCRQMVVVPCPKQPGQEGLAFARGCRVAAEQATVGRVILAASGVALAMLVPGFGLHAAAAMLAVAGVALIGRTLDRTSRGTIEVEPIRGRRRAVLVATRCLVAGLMAAATVLALWGMDYSHQRGPRWDRAGRVLFAVTWTVFPLVALAVFGRDRRSCLGVRQGLRVAARHPGMMILVLAVVPASVVLAEMMLVVGTIWQGTFPFLVLDLLPFPEHYIRISGIPAFNGIDFRSYPVDRFLALYGAGLGHGRTLFGSLPASLSLPTTNDLNSAGIYVSSATYLAFRVLLSGFAAAMLLAAANLQAAWLGSLAAVDHRRVV